MRPGSSFLADLDSGRTDGRTRWVNVHGGADRVVPEGLGTFQAAGPGVLAMRESSAGHASIARHPDVVAGIVSALLRSEEAAGQTFSLAA
jgi:hypothetical protein